MSCKATWRKMGGDKRMWKRKKPIWNPTTGQNVVSSVRWRYQDRTTTGLDIEGLNTAGQNIAGPDMGGGLSNTYSTKILLRAAYRRRSKCVGHPSPWWCVWRTNCSIITCMQWVRTKFHLVFTCILLWLFITIRHSVHYVRCSLAMDLMTSWTRIICLLKFEYHGTIFRVASLWHHCNDPRRHARHA